VRGERPASLLRSSGLREPVPSVRGTTMAVAIAVLNALRLLVGRVCIELGARISEVREVVVSTGQAGSGATFLVRPHWQQLTEAHDGASTSTQCRWVAARPPKQVSGAQKASTLDRRSP
jgi:hypothetical protein